MAQFRLSLVLRLANITKGITDSVQPTIALAELEQECKIKPRALTPFSSTHLRSNSQQRGEIKIHTSVYKDITNTGRGWGQWRKGLFYLENHTIQRTVAPRCISIDKRLNKIWSIHVIEYDSAIKRNEVLIRAKHR